MKIPLQMVRASWYASAAVFMMIEDAMTDYKATLNLPQTEFPMRGNLPVREPQLLDYWIKIDLYQRIRNKMKGKPRFILHDGPPYANARPHLGTALNKILKDMVVKSKTLQGFDAPFVPGWDCHGLPIELNVEKKSGKPGERLSPQAFRTACRTYAEEQVELQRADFKRLGVFADWDRPYLTMDFTYEANVVRALGQIIENGYLVQGKKPVHWCTACGSALAEAEVEYRDKTSSAIDVLFEAVVPQQFLERFKITTDFSANVPVYVPIWTTTPWTLPANEAVCLHPTIHYALVKWHRDDRPVYVVLARDLVDAAMVRWGVSDYEVHGHLTGSALEGLLLKHPFLDKRIPVIVGEHVTVEMGTGCVHTAPAHGHDDYLVGLQYELPVETPVGSNGRFSEQSLVMPGTPVLEANEGIIVLLADNGRLAHHEKLTHSYPHCWRHKTPLIFRATPQWFIRIEQNGLRDEALAAITHVKWTPSWGETRIHNMVANRPDWCISRQRTWGTPLPLFVHRQTGTLHPNTLQWIELVALRIEKQGVEAWHQLDPEELLGEEAKHYEKITDILDVWFDSGVTHACVLKTRKELQFPADLYLEGSDQHRGWFQSSLLASLAMGQEAPFKAVLTHGYVVDGEGRKMSKSLGNVIAPSEVVDQSGADVLRLWVASVDHTADINVSKEILTRMSDAYRRIRNTARFLLANLFDFDPSCDQVTVDQMAELDRWMLHQTIALQERIIEAYEMLRFPAVYQEILNFCTVELGSFYLDVIKDRQYTAKKDSIARRSAQTVLFHILEAFVRWIAPILSFTAEEIWRLIPGSREESIFLVEWYKDFPKTQMNESTLARWHQLMQVRDVVNKALEEARVRGELGSGLEARVMLYGDDQLVNILSPLGEELRFALITSEAQIHPMAKKDGKAVPSALPGLSIAIEVLSQEKCARCWHRREDVGQHAEHPELCGRCVGNVEGQGEVRQYA